jgi:hypothetical protein
MTLAAKRNKCREYHLKRPKKMTSGTNEAIIEETQNEWRSLGFNFEYDKEKRLWRIIGSQKGIKRFCQSLLDYSQDLQHQKLSEHEHYGPYMDLKFATADQPDANPDGLFGRLEDFHALFKLLNKRLGKNPAEGMHIIVRDDFPFSSGGGLEVVVADDDFDPAAADPKLIKCK